MSHFKVKAKHKLEEMELGDVIEESDFASLTPSGVFVQLEYVDEEDKNKPYTVKPGIWAIKKQAGTLKLEKTSFVQDHILDSFVNTKNITDKIDCFFSRLHVYKEHGIEIPKRAALLYGPPGGGKTSTLKKVAETYNSDGKTAVIIWPTDVVEAYEVKSFIRNFLYKGVEKLILVAEDIGGVEMDKVRMKSDSSLLSLLDNQEKTFTIPIFIIATTNFPEVFLGNLTNRPGRFDDKIECTYPDAKSRQELMKFFYKKEVPQDILDLLADKKYKEFSPAHLKEVVIRSAIYDISLNESIELIRKEIEHYNKAFSKQKAIGINSPDYD